MGIRYSYIEKKTGRNKHEILIYLIRSFNLQVIIK